MENLDHSNNKNVSLSLIAAYGESDSDSEYTETQSNTGNEDSDTAELSEMVLKNNIINACAHGPLARSILRDDEDTTRHMIIDSSASGVVEYEVTEYRDSSDSDSSDSSNSDVDSVKDIEEISSGDEETVNRNEKPEPPRVQGELALDDLPPIEDLAISLPAQETTKIGTIASIVDRLVIVRSFPDTPAVDLDSILFLDNGAKTLGKVFDVFGPVTEPHYCVRFNSQEHVKDRGVQPGLDVYIAPRSQQHTNYVFLNELMKLKGSDASWRNDIEPPPSQVDYSDDEEERKANRARKEQNRQNKEENSENNGETSKNRRPTENRRNQRPSESSSRFGSGPSRGRNPFAAGSRRNNPNTFPRFARPWLGNMDMRTPPHPNDPGGHPPFSAPPFSPNMPPMFQSYTPRIPASFMGNAFQFGANPRMPGPIPPMGVPPFRHGVPVFGANFCNLPGPQPQWINGLPPPPGT
ncbi:H/ACA ribonucleoprotein complex non-core subunit NAF1 [Achroia grisella]|uniref:H/ACA ribonucleoprotein complex non-core subunit NAF1 n=1 Tax=Achroia grisella TaxID=688607 RepID=UPI0027D2F195|nr:H/ACA ribonucleoprotein complex non-core subunit NAF1 [Achroia grisella]